METANDERIIELFFARSEQAIIELSRAYGAMFHRIASNILKNASMTPILPLGIRFRRRDQVPC